MRPLKIAVAGAGLAGLSAAWHLSLLGAKVDLFDSVGIGGGASGASTGLLHPFTGKKAQRSIGSEEGMKEAKKLLQIASDELGCPVCADRGIFRPAITEQQKSDYAVTAAADTQAEWKTVDLPGFPDCPGLWIPSGAAVYSQLYLEGLWKACLSRGARLFQEFLDPTSLPNGYDAYVLSLGAGIRKTPFYMSLNLKSVIGQMLVCQTSQPPPFPLVSEGHITPTEDSNVVLVGSTYEHTEQPDPNKALELIEKVALFYPPARDFVIHDAKWGVRIAPKSGYLPVVEQVAPRTWVITGLGSRGLLYHAAIGKDLALRIHTELN